MGFAARRTVSKGGRLMRCFPTFTIALAAAGLLGLVVPVRADDPDARTGEKVAHARGRITDVRASDRQVTLQTRKGEELKLTVDDQSRLQLNGQDVRLDQF